MATSAFLLLASFLLALILLAKPLSSLLTRFIDGAPLPLLGRVERVVWRVSGIPMAEMNWQRYALAILLFNLLKMVLLFATLMLQASLLLNPQRLPGLSWHLALNTVISFVTNTNWQACAGESTLSYFSQMAGLTMQNVLSAATGIAVAFALIRAFARRSSATLGNAWVDIPRITLWLLLLLSLVLALLFIQQGVPQTLLLYPSLTTLEGARQTLPLGPVASQERLKSRAPTAAAFLTPIRPPVRKPLCFNQYGADAGDFADPGGALFCLRRSGRRCPPRLCPAVDNGNRLCRLRGAGNVGLNSG